ncbi:hypothetical protein A4A49_23779 [Nicotiana attenuata]|uniref:Uncharacterized protein n=1 Tax=Nicotiana attenuata TaxID=49451 RepID=A0A314LGQ6_NICAT|nr:hypothetical protein A4A49_23779 [Nicotiana attenuata]
MAHFRDYTSPSSEHKYLIIDVKNGGVITKLLTYPPLVGRYANLWPSLQNSLHTVDWTLEHNQKPTKMWSLQPPYQRKLNITSTLPCLGRCMIQREIRWEDTLRIDESLVTFVGPITAAPLEITPQEHNKEDKPPTLKSKVVAPCDIKGPPYKEAQKKKGPYQAHQVHKGSFPLGTVVPTSNKRPSQNESDSSHGDQNFKPVKPYSNKQGDTDLGVVEITDSIGSASRTLAVIKEPNDGHISTASQQSKPEGSSESVANPDSRKSLLISKSDLEATSIPNLGAKSGPHFHQRLAPTMSVFDGRKVILTLHKDFILNAWDKIHTKLSDLTAFNASPVQFEIQVILEEIDRKGVDISPLKDLLTSFFKVATSHDQARSILSDKVVDVEKSEPFLKAKEHFDLVLTGKREKVEELFVTSQSLKEAKEKEKQLRALRDTAKKEVEEIESRVLSAEEEYCRCSDVSLVTADDLANVETKKQHLEATLKDSVNYKLCLD